VARWGRPLSEALDTVLRMRVEATFVVESFVPSRLEPPPEPVVTGTPADVAVMRKRFEGGVVGVSTTLFTSAFDQAAGTGTYVALESFEGSIGGAVGAFCFVHGASTSGSDRSDEHFAVVPGSGTGDLAGVTGSGGLQVEEDGTHRLWLDLALPSASR
jgi:Protein of unknown function (DUF3224)